MRIVPTILACCAVAWLSADAALAQSRARIFNVELGTPVSELPADEWVDPACGTNGGPPSLELESFEDFARCPVEPQTGLREVWFIYDDEWEYIARANRSPAEIARYSANTFYQQPIITSLLIDDGGLVQGYRVVTDPRAPVEVRRQAYTLFGIFKTQFGNASWDCTDLPRDEREQPIHGTFLKTACQSASDQRFIRLEGRHLHKPGEDIRFVPRSLEQAEGDFESSVRLEVYAAEAVRDAPCCRASAPQ